MMMITNMGRMDYGRLTQLKILYKSNVGNIMSGSSANCSILLEHALKRFNTSAVHVHAFEN